jgi:hypothetical protein
MTATSTPRLRANVGSDPETVVEAAVTALQQIDAVLMPIIGKRAIDALLQRSLVQTSATHPWLDQVWQNDVSATPYARIQAAMARQSSAEAAAASAALLQMFIALLTSQIGQRLTERLLRPVEGAALRIPRIEERN